MLRASALPLLVDIFDDRQKSKSTGSTAIKEMRATVGSQFQSSLRF